MFGKILVVIILIVFIVMVVNNIPQILSYFKNSNFFKFNFTPISTFKKSSSNGSQNLPFSIISGYKVKVAPSSSSVLQQGYIITPQVDQINKTNNQYQQPFNQYNQSIYNSQYQQVQNNSNQIPSGQGTGSGPIIPVY